MLIPFKSKAAADFFMLQAHAQTLIEAMGMVYAPQGIIAAEHLASRLVLLRQALESTEATALPSTVLHPDEDPALVSAVGFKQRAWPLLAMLEASVKQNVDVLWGQSI